MSKEIYEYRGVEGLVAAEVLKDNNESGEGYVTGEVFDIAGVAEIGRTTENGSETHYYDNMPAIVINSTGADTVTCSVAAIPLDVLAKITGHKWDNDKGMFVEGQRDVKYFALGYKTKKTNGDEVFVWRFKGQFSIPDSTHTTENDGTDANGQEIVFTGISTTHKFATLGNKPAKAINVDVALGKADVSTFFDEVTTPDSLQPAGDYTLTITEDDNTTVRVTRNGTPLTSGAAINTGDVLTISCEGGTLEVNSETFTSGSTHTVAGNVTVVSTVN